MRLYLTASLMMVLLAACSQQAPSPGNATVSKPEQAANAPEQAPRETANAATAEGMNMSDAEHERMVDEGRKPMPSATSTSASATGTIQSVDAAAGNITIAHGPVAALGWPAMTMTFKASPEQVASVKAGEKVDFAFESKGMQATITRIDPAK